MNENSIKLQPQTLIGTFTISKIIIQFQKNGTVFTRIPFLKLLIDQELDLIKYFISSDSAITQLENSFLRKCLAPGLKVNSPWTLKKFIIII